MSEPRKSRAGSVKTTAAASPSPAEPTVCTMFFSRMLERPERPRMPIAMTAIGIDAEVVRPTLRPR